MPRNDDAARVAALTEPGVLDTPGEDRYDRITRLAADLFGVGGASVNLIDRDRQFVKSTTGGLLDQGTEFPREQAICAVTIQQDATLVVEDLSEDDRFIAMARESKATDDTTVVVARRTT